MSATDAKPAIAKVRPRTPVAEQSAATAIAMTTASTSRLSRLLSEVQATSEDAAVINAKIGKDHRGSPSTATANAPAASPTPTVVATWIAWTRVTVSTRSAEPSSAASTGKPGRSRLMPGMSASSACNPIAETTFVRQT